MASLNHRDHPLELEETEVRQLVDAALERTIDFLSTLSSQPAADTAGGADLARQVVESLPETSTSRKAILDQLFDELIPVSFNTAGPGYLAYIPGGGLVQSAVADLISSAVNRYVGVWAAAPALAQLETTVIDWFCQIVGYPDRARGYLASGGSLANFSAIVTAREEKLGRDFSRGTLYVSDQVHHCVLKAARLAGIPEDRVVEIASCSDFRMDLESLNNTIEADRRRGLRPFLVVGSAGTTNTGAVDALQDIARLSKTHGLWFHVDAAYGGFFMLTERGRLAMRGIEMADSITLDPHKGLFLPYGTGCLLARDGEALKRAHSSSGLYMPPMQNDPDFVDFCEISPELSRSFRGLRVWLPVKLHGIAPFRDCLDEKLDLIAYACQEIEKIPGLEIFARPQLSIVAFRYFNQNLSLKDLNDLNKTFLEAINKKQRVYLTSTTLGSSFVIRICILSFRTHLDRINICLDDIRSALVETLDLWGLEESDHG